jgi:hypothetical protein
MNIQYRVSYSFVSLPFTAIGDFTDTIINGMTGNVGYPNSPVALTLVETQKMDYLAKLAATAQGGTLATVAKNNAWDVLIGSLRQLAGYVQSLAGNNQALLISSGFSPISNNRAQSPLTTPLILVIDNSVTGTLIVRVQPVTNARSYEVQIKTGAGAWQSALISPAARRMVLSGLISVSIYQVQVRAIGGSTGFSNWSNPATGIVT